MKEVTLQVNRGERLAVMGPSGSGKTSLLLIAAGLEKASSGRVVFDGQDITGLNEDQLATFRRGTVGVVFQNFHLIPTMTALENVAVPLEVAGVKNAFSRRGTRLKALPCPSARSISRRSFPGASSSA